jgi:hypothetical protein
MNRKRKGGDAPGPVRQITPNLTLQVRVLLNAFISEHQELSRSGLAGGLRGLHRTWKNEGWSLELRAVALVLADLLDQGWWVTPIRDTIELQPPGTLLAGETAEEAKGRLRDALRTGRARQLAEPGVVVFLKRMHRPVPRVGRSTELARFVWTGFPA